MMRSSPEQARCDSTMNRSWHSSRQVDGGNANSASSQQGRQKKVAARLDAELAEECPAQFAINLIQGKWKTRILFQLQRGPVRLSELRRMLPEASKKVLAQHLREMEKDGLVIRQDLSGRLRHVQYSLSDSMGFAVLNLINTLAEWGREYLPYEPNRVGVSSHPPRGFRIQTRSLPKMRQETLTKAL
ncbi:MAG: transcriptional regulator, HxlR family [Edaphobacter sp.]|nr:transcriptional regulator, HxlR family [Edaphobacter sp.]